MERKKELVSYKFGDSDPTYRHERGAGRDRSEIPINHKAIVLARQMQLCAFCLAILDPPDEIEDYFSFHLEKPEWAKNRFVKPAWIEHIIAKSLHGEDDISNLAYTCDYCNRYKWNFIIVWAGLTAARFGETIDGHDFRREANEFLDYYKRNKELKEPWPWWMWSEKTKEPEIFGWNGKQLDAYESVLREEEIFRKNILEFSRWNKHNGRSIMALIER